jgi:hypothetical protein
LFHLVSELLPQVLEVEFFDVGEAVLVVDGPGEALATSEGEKFANFGSNLVLGVLLICTDRFKGVF